MKHYFVWEWQKIKIDGKGLGQRSLSMVQRVIFPQVDKLMTEMEGLKKKDLPSDQWERRFIYKETDKPEEVEVLKEKLKNIGVTKINQVIQKAKTGHYRLIPKKIRDKLSTIERDEENAPLEKAAQWLMTFGIYWNYTIYTESEFNKLQEEK